MFMHKIRIPVIFAKLISALVLMSLAMISSAQESTLEEISYSALPGDQVQIQLRLSGPMVEPGSFTIDNPARIAMDFPGTKSNLASKTTDVGIGVARNISTVEAGGRTRVVINLAKLIPYETKVEGDSVFVTLLGAGGTVGQEGGVTAAVPATGSGVQDIDFRRGDKGEGRVIITMANPNTAIDMSRRGDRVIVTLKDSTISSELERRLDVLDFATPVRTVDSFGHGPDVRLIIAASGEFEHIAYQTDNKLTIDVKKYVKPKVDIAKKKEQFTGERLSLNFQNIEVRAVLQLIADFTGVNMVTSDSVSGNVTLRLKNVPWDQALDIILKSKGLAKREKGNVMMIAPAAEIAAQEKLELEAQKQIVELAPLISDSIQINYARAEEMAALLQSKGNSLVSERGNITVDPRTNRLLVQDTSANIDAIAALVDELDIPVRQVLIESRVVLVTTNFTKELGVRFGITSETVQGSRQAVTSGDLNATTDFLNGDPLELDDRLNVNLPVASPAGSLALAVAKLPFGTLLELELSAAQAEGRSEIISSPKVITSDQQKAIIKQGQEIPYAEAASSGAATVAFKEAVLSLEVTPAITPDDRINMELKVNKDAPDFGNLLNTGLGSQAPPINTQEVQTKVLVDNGETIVLGGVYEQTKSLNVNRVPFFSDIPLLGVLFRSRNEQDDKNELLIFVTPKIVKEAINI